MRLIVSILNFQFKKPCYPNASLVKFKFVTGTTDSSGNITIDSNDIDITKQTIISVIPTRESGYYNTFYTCSVGVNAAMDRYVIRSLNVNNALVQNQSIKVKICYVDYVS